MALVGPMRYTVIRFGIDQTVKPYFGNCDCQVIRVIRNYELKKLEKSLKSLKNWMNEAKTKFAFTLFILFLCVIAIFVLSHHLIFLP